MPYVCAHAFFVLFYFIFGVFGPRYFPMCFVEGVVFFGGGWIVWFAFDLSLRSKSFKLDPIKLVKSVLFFSKPLG